MMCFVIAFFFQLVFVWCVVSTACVCAQNESTEVVPTVYVRHTYKVKHGFFEAHWYAAFSLLLVIFGLIALALWFIIRLHFAEGEQEKRREQDLSSMSSSKEVDNSEVSFTASDGDGFSHDSSVTC
ncbi:hypothetical protein LSM04_009487 [Trypanosoma melophagium]|uniref:uncharacterized protein n=1 Tax=Trypanosoma melophagium TaxID=715481 RepID=UPI003519E9BC|nr:hypothetical protein LSM04_009487 [Trypanosoma melophagium]